MAQSALTTSLGAGYSVLGYDVDLDGLQAVEVLQGPQMDVGVSLGLGPVFSVGFDGDFTLSNGGTQVAGVETFDLLSAADYRNHADSKRADGFYASAGVNVGLHFGDYKPKAGVAYTRIETANQNGISLRQFSCFDWNLKLIDFDFATAFNVVAEYKQSLPTCVVDYKSASFALRVTF